MNPGVLIYSPPPYLETQLAGCISSGHRVVVTLSANKYKTNIWKIQIQKYKTQEQIFGEATSGVHITWTPCSRDSPCKEIQKQMQNSSQMPLTQKHEDIKSKITSGSEPMTSFYTFLKTGKNYNLVILLSIIFFLFLPIGPSGFALAFAERV